MNGAQFARFVGVRYSTLMYWLQKRRKEAGQGEETASSRNDHPVGRKLLLLSSFLTRMASPKHCNVLFVNIMGRVVYYFGFHRGEAAWVCPYSMVWGGWSCGSPPPPVVAGKGTRCALASCVYPARN
jgi:hypothetical protein